MNNEPINLIIVGYVRRSSHMQKDNFSIDAQKRAIREECLRRQLPEPVFYEDDERSARSEQIAKRPAFRRLLDDVQAGRIQMIMVHTLDRWSRNVMVTLQTFRILFEYHTAFLSLTEHIDYSTPEGRLQLTILAAFAAYFSDMLAKHTSKGKGERAAQGLPNGDIPFGYRRSAPKSPPEINPHTFPGLRLIGELRMQGMSAQAITDQLNAAGYRTGSKRFGDRLFTIDTINAITRNEFYAAYEPGDDRGTILYHGVRYRGQHQAAFTREEWQRIRNGSRLNYKAPHRATQARRIYEFSGYITDIQCGLLLRCKTLYYKDVANVRHLPCPAGGHLQVRVDLVHTQFAFMLEKLGMPPCWHSTLQQQACHSLTPQKRTDISPKREKERLLLKRTRLLKQYREGYIHDQEFESEMAAVSLALLECEKLAQSQLNNTISPGAIGLAVEHLPDLSLLWRCATAAERRAIVMFFLEPGGLLYDLEQQRIVAIKPRSSFFPHFRSLPCIERREEETGILFFSHPKEK
jgi:site-specific DNA recombinase